MSSPELREMLAFVRWSQSDDCCNVKDIENERALKIWRDTFDI